MKKDNKNIVTGNRYCSRIKQKIIKKLGGFCYCLDGKMFKIGDKIRINYSSIDGYVYGKVTKFVINVDSTSCVLRSERNEYIFFGEDGKVRAKNLNFDDFCYLSWP